MNVFGDLGTLIHLAHLSPSLLCSKIIISNILECPLCVEKFIYIYIYLFYNIVKDDVIYMS